MTTHHLKSVDAECSSETNLPVFSQRSNFAVQHLLAAARFSQQCGTIESENRGKPFGPFFSDQQACVSATLMLSVASLESNINEDLEDIDKLLPEFSHGARSEIAGLLSRLSILDKYSKVLALKELPPFGKGAAPYQDAQLLVDIRNELVHFHPEWHDNQKRHEKIGSRAKGRFDLSPFLPADEVIFPARIVSHGCTQWAVNTALSFMEEFATKVGMSNKFSRSFASVRP